MIFQFVKGTSHLPSGALWNNFTFQSIGSPSKSLHLLHKPPGSTSHQDTPHCTFTWPSRRPCNGPCLSCQSVPGSSPSPWLLWPARWLQCSRGHSQPRPLPRGIARPCAQHKPRAPPMVMMPHRGARGKARKPEARTPGYHKPIFLFQAIFCTGWGPNSSSGKQRKPVSPPPTLLGPFCGLDVIVEHLHRNPQ